MISARRHARTIYRLASMLGLILLVSPRDAAAQEVSLDWLGGTPPPVSQGVSWGVPWLKGAIKADQHFSLATADGKPLPLQSWPLAYWPDGSVKWSGFATVAGSAAAAPFKLTAGRIATEIAAVSIKESSEAVEIDTGRLRCRIPRQGNSLIDSMSINGQVVARQGRLICVLQNGPDGDAEDTPKRERHVSSVSKVVVEQSGPVRAVVRIEGIHASENYRRRWLPFQVRLYFYAGQEAVRLVHSIVFDGDEQKDFIRGLAVVFDVPMREQMHNRHVRFSGEGTGLWAEPIQPLKGRDGRFVAGSDGRDVYPDQVAGRRVPNQEAVNARGQDLLKSWAVWDSFKLVQPNADGFTIVKRTNPQSCWLPAGAGRRASGMVFAGDVSGGLGIGIKNFWQSYPASLEVLNASGTMAELRAWLWSPDGPAMDLRHYDTRAHGLEEVYEDVQPGFSTPHGVARTSELTLIPGAGVPTKAETVQLAQLGSRPPLLVCTPQYLHSVRALGIWSLPERSTPFKRAVEEQLDGTIAYYQKAIEQHSWYGFWDFGDVMHSYDATRHVWRYDLGGMAWDNTELGTDMWLWTSFLRSGRADIFRMAEAMTRHTSEVDVYHLGRFAGLGSRHNVRHWGCGAKEPRISQAAYRRYYYYLTTDERAGDVMREVLDADFKTAEIDPMRLASPITEDQKKYPGRIRGGPDWLAFVGNWMTEWERTGNSKYRDKMLAGMNSIVSMPFGFRSGTNLLFGYDPAGGKLFTLTDVAGDYNLATIMGGAEVIFELNEFIDHPGWQKAWLQYCRLTSAPQEVLTRDRTTGTEGADGAFARPDRLAAYAYWRTKNPAFARRAVSQLLGRRGVGAYTTQRVEGPEVLNPLDEAPGVGTNGAAQSSLIAIEVLEMCADQLPESIPPRNEGPGGTPVRPPRGAGREPR